MALGDRLEHVDIGTGDLAVGSYVGIGLFIGDTGAQAFTTTLFQ